MATPMIFCSRCGTRLIGNERFCASCGAIIAAPDTATAAASFATQAESSLLNRRYRVLQTVGKGGMSAVYMGQDMLLGYRLVAIKEMIPKSMDHDRVQKAVMRFKREAHMLAGLQHPNLPGIYDHFTEDERWYLVMSFIPGETLTSYLARAQDGKLPLDEGLSIGIDLCSVLGYLHGQMPPIIFRDLKPSNIMRNPEGHIYLIDFGIARHFKPGQDKDTTYFASKGYAPIEQYGRAQTTERSDIYSLGVTLYQCFSGYNPMHSPLRLPPLQALVPTLPERLTRLITKMIEIEEKKRPASIKDVQIELQQIQKAQQTTPEQFYTPPPPPPPPSTPSDYANLYPPIYMQPRLTYNITPLVQPSVGAKILSYLRKFVTVIGMTIGTLFVALGILGSFVGGEGIFIDLWFADLCIFFGLTIFFLARIRRYIPPVPPGQKIWATLGTVVAIVAVLSGLLLTILGAVTNTAINNHANGSITGIFSICEGGVIWWSTRIKFKKLR